MLPARLLPTDPITTRVRTLPRIACTIQLPRALNIESEVTCIHAWLLTRFPASFLLLLSFPGKGVDYSVYVKSDPLRKRVSSSAVQGDSTTEYILLVLPILHERAW